VAIRRVRWKDEQLGKSISHTKHDRSSLWGWQFSQGCKLANESGEPAALKDSLFASMLVS
jgi:hypothetical protein